MDAEVCLAASQVSVEGRAEQILSYSSAYVLNELTKANTALQYLLLEWRSLVPKLQAAGRDPRLEGRLIHVQQQVGRSVLLGVT